MEVQRFQKASAHPTPPKHTRLPLNCGTPWAAHLPLPTPPPLASAASAAALGTAPTRCGSQRPPLEYAGLGRSTRRAQALPACTPGPKLALESSWRPGKRRGKQLTTKRHGARTIQQARLQRLQNTRQRKMSRTLPVSVHWMRSSVPNLKRRVVGSAAAPGRRLPAACSARLNTSSRCPKNSCASCTAGANNGGSGTDVNEGQQVNRLETRQTAMAPASTVGPQSTWGQNRD